MSPKTPQTKKNSPPDPYQKGAAQPAPKKTTQLSLRGRALRLLGRREFTRQELEKRLRAYVDADNPSELEALLADLAARGWLSDARYAAALVRQRKDRYGKRALAQRLKQAGVSAADTAEALAGIDGETEFTTAGALVRRKFRHPPADEKEKARQVRFLQARGYSLNLALRVIKHAGSDNEESGD